MYPAMDRAWSPTVSLAGTTSCQNPTQRRVTHPSRDSSSVTGLRSSESRPRSPDAVEKRNVTLTKANQRLKNRITELDEHCTYLQQENHRLHLLLEQEQAGDV
ncbi:expressed unknown protein [Seminavis robusta]|uniref:Uncharacterized protein n=1 Tax=Seminavis robusta TaxID=568900 RepID=A0A9N8HXG7_9STRA|nr:expressed unknown protein [Seminavis robusta]|eukprot:Sro1805_g298780.1 n/a (103) ;mRNA; r:7821-8129